MAAFDIIMAKFTSVCKTHGKRVGFCRGGNVFGAGDSKVLEKN